MITARRKDKVANREMWSVKPKNHQELVSLPEYEQVIGQLYHLEKGIMEANRSCANFRFLTVHYEDFCEQPSTIVKLISSYIFDGQIGERKGAISPKVIKRPKESKEKQHLVELAGKYDWDNYTTP